MTYQISAKDVRKAIWNMKSNIALVICSESSPRVSFYVQFLAKEDGTPYYTCGYQIENVSSSLGENVTIPEAIKIFNKELINWDNQKD